MEAFIYLYTWLSGMLRHWGIITHVMIIYDVSYHVVGHLSHARAYDLLRVTSSNHQTFLAAQSWHQTPTPEVPRTKIKYRKSMIFVGEISSWVWALVTRLSGPPFFLWQSKHLHPQICDSRSGKLTIPSQPICKATRTAKRWTHNPGIRAGKPKVAKSVKK